MNNQIYYVLHNIFTENELESLSYYVENVVLSFEVTKNVIKENNLISIENHYGNMSFGKFAWLTVQAFDYLKEYEACKKLIAYIEENINKLNPTDKHYFYISCFKLFYKPKNKNICNYKLCEKYCLLIFDNWDTFKNFYINSERDKFLSAFKTQLNYGLISEEEYKIKINNIKIPILGLNFNYVNIIKVYERLGDYDKAIDYCAEALLEVGNDDGTKSGFTGRYNRLLKKINKMK